MRVTGAHLLTRQGVGRKTPEEEKVVSEYVEVVETTDDGRYRVILVQDTDCESPIAAGDAWVTSVLTLDADRWGGARWNAMRDPEDRLESLYYLLEALRDGEDAFKRYMRIFHGIEVFDVTIHNGYRDTSSALAWVEPSEAERVGVNLGEGGRIVVRQEVDEYNRWADGDVWGYVVQERVTWAKIPDDGTEYRPGDMHPMTETRETWEDTDESCFGFIGYEYAEQEAREALAGVAA